jgi:uncharacterized membrane protein (DUF485 family)
MSVVNTHTPIEEAPPKRARELLEDALPFIFAVPVAGPPAILLLGPWLLLVLLIIPPAAFLITLVLVVVVAVGLVVGLGALIASPYFLVHHLSARHAARVAHRAADAAPAVDPAPAPGPSRWVPAPAAGLRSMTPGR